MEKIKGGYYIKPRAIQLSEIAKAPPHVREVWDWLIANANHAPYKNINRGEVLCTYKDIIDGLEWYVGWRRNTYTKAHMTTAMRYLKKHLMVTTRRTTRGFIVTICNYSYYQDPKNYREQQGTDTRDTPRGLQGKQHEPPHEALHDIQEEEEEKEISKKKEKTIEKESTSLAEIEVNNNIAIRTENFEKLWLAYPTRRGRKIGKAQALEKFLKMKAIDIPLLVKAVHNLASDTDTLPKDFHRFIKDRNGEPYRDWVEVVAPERSKGVDKYRRAEARLSRGN